MKKILFSIGIIAAACFAYGEKIATQTWVEGKIKTAVSTNTLTEASVNAIIEAQKNNGEMFCDENGTQYFYVLTRTADGQYVNKRKELVVTGSTNILGTLRGMYVLSSNIPEVPATNLFGFVMKDGAPVLTNGKMQFAYIEDTANKGETDYKGNSLEWSRVTISNEFACGSVAIGDYAYSFNLTNAVGEKAYITQAFLFSENWVKATGETNTTAYTGVDEAVHWSTNAFYRDSKTALSVKYK